MKLERVDEKESDVQGNRTEDSNMIIAVIEIWKTGEFGGQNPKNCSYVQLSTKIPVPRF